MTVTDDIFDILADPVSGRNLLQTADALMLDEATIAKKVGDVWSFLDEKNSFYEGSYQNRTRHIPQSDNVLHRFPFFFVTNGYVWEVCKHFARHCRLLELGCASGVDYLAKRYEMVGLDYSLVSLQGLNGYSLRVQADAERLPFGEKVFSGAISSYFWEHIEPAAKDRILQALYRCIRPGGRIVFLYDIATNNALINAARCSEPKLYQKSFLDCDGHIGYETEQENEARFEANGFRVLKQIGMERTWLQSASVYKKLVEFPGRVRHAGRLGVLLSRGRFGYYLRTMAVRMTDASIGKLWPIGNSRILMTVAEREIE